MTSGSGYALTCREPGARGLPESRVVALWESVARRGTVLSTASGETVRVVYPGRRNHGRGADFCDAVIATDSGTITGDIEVHTRSGEWQAHGHHENPDYNRVVLHVAFRQDHGGAAMVQDGREVPLVVLEGYPGRRGARAAPGCRSRGAGHSGTAEGGAGLLDSAGDERFRLKAGRFGADFGMAPGQSLYRGLMGALGYSQNKRPFLELARRLPLHVVEGVGRDLPDSRRLQALEAVLLGTAGLLPSQRRLPGPDDPWIAVLEGLWASHHPGEAMRAGDWDLFRVRPNNSPVRRLVAMGHLLLRYRQSGLLAGMIDLVREVPPEAARRGIEAGLVVTAAGYWAGHCDFGRTSRGVGPSLLGRSRAADIIVNVVLPFTFAWGGSDGDTALEKKCLDVYRGYPKLAPNGIERHMTGQLGVGGLVSSARRQQGLLHIYESLCTRGRCDACPLGGMVATGKGKHSLPAMPV